MKIEKVNCDYYSLKMTDKQKLNALDDIMKVTNKNKNRNNDDLLDAILMMMRVYGLLEYK